MKEQQQANLIAAGDYMTRIIDQSRNRLGCGCCVGLEGYCEHCADTFDDITKAIAGWLIAKANATD